MNGKLEAPLRQQLAAAGDARVDLIIRTTEAPGEHVAACEARGMTVRHVYKLLPGIAVSAPAAAALALESEPWVERIETDRSVHTM
ncbi:MAG: hypothetical protein U0822_21670 [Anaerolineae bacterium]